MEIPGFLANLDYENIWIGLLTLLTTIGFKYVHKDLDNTNAHQILQSKWMRRLYIFGFIYLATKDYKISILLSLMYLLFVKCCDKKENINR